MSEPKIQPVPDRADLWIKFQELAPQLFDEGGNLRQPPPVQRMLELIAKADSDRSDEALQYGVYRLAYREGDSFSPADLALIRQAVEHLGIVPYATARPAPPPPTRWKPVKEAAVVPAGPTILFERTDRAAVIISDVAELRLAETSTGGLLIWDIQLNRPIDLADFKRFVSSCWSSAQRQNWLNGKRLFVQFFGTGSINANPDLVQVVLVNALPTAKEVILVLPAQLAETLPASSAPSEEVRRLLAELRALPATRHVGLSRQTTQEIRRIRGLWTLFYNSLDAPEIPVGVWQSETRKLAPRIVKHLPPASQSKEIISALARALYEELVAAQMAERAKTLAPLPDRTGWNEETLAPLRPAATQLIAEVRPQPAVLGGNLSAQKTATAVQIERVWNRFYDSLEIPEVPKEMWQELAHRFAKKIATYIPQERLTGEIMLLLAAADVVYKEAQQTFRESAYKAGRLAKALSSLSAQKVIELSGKYKLTLLHVAFAHEDPIRVVERLDQNRQAAEAYLRKQGFGEIAKTISLQAYVLAADSAEMAEVRALESAKAPQTGKPKVVERVDTEPPPPSPSSPEKLLAQLFEHKTKKVPRAEAESIGEIFGSYFAGLERPEIGRVAWTRLTKKLSQRVASYRRRVKVSDDLVRNLAQRVYADFVVAKRELGLDENLLSSALGRWTLPELRAILSQRDQETAVPLSKQPAGKRGRSAAQATHQPSFHLDPTQSPEESVRQIIAAVRACEDRKGHISQESKPFYERMFRLWDGYYSEVTDPAVPRDLWLQVGKTFGLLTARLMSHLEVSDPILKQAAHVIYEELHQVLTELTGRGDKIAICSGITKLGAAQIIELYRIFPDTFVAKFLRHPDAKGETERRLGYYQSAKEHLESSGLQDIPPRVIGMACVQPTVEAVLREARRLAEEFAAERISRIKTGLSEEVATEIAVRHVRVLPLSSRGPKLYSGPAIVQQGWERAENWWQTTQGKRLSATPQILKHFGLAEPATIRGRLIRYGPAEGIPGLIAVFAAPAVTQSVLGINPHRQVASFHIANLGAMHMLNATGGAIADIIPQIGRGMSAVRLGREVVTSPSLSRTFLRGTGQKLLQVGGLAEGVVWAYPGYVAGDTLAGVVTDNPTARAIGGGVGAIGVPTGLKIWLGEKGMQRLAQTAVGRAAGPVGAVFLAKDIGAGMYETMVRQDFEDAEIALRERVIHELPWYDQQFCQWSEALFMSGIGVILGLPGVVACEPAIAAKMDAIDGGSRRLRFRTSPADLQQFQSRIMSPF